MTERRFWLCMLSLGLFCAGVPALLYFTSWKAYH